MMNIAVRRSAIVALVALAGGCGYDSNAPALYDVPPVAAANEGLWVASASSPAILRLAPPQLLGDGRVTPSSTLTTSSATLFTVNGLAFDAAGTLWIASADDSLLLAFSSEALAASGSSVASRVIAPTERSLSAPSAIAFDRLHRLWVANFVAGTLVRFDSMQLAASGAPKPAVILTGLSRPTAIAFDASGSLWVANSHTNLVVKYSAAQLEVSGSPTPQVVLSAFGSSLSNPFALAFDASGTLWVSNVGKGTIVGFGSQKLAAAGSPPPDVELATNSLPFGIPVGLALDGQGSLWIVSAEGALLELARSQLDASGAKDPKARLLVNGHTLLSGLAFWPKPPGLPIN